MVQQHELKILDDNAQRDFGKNVARLSKQMVKEDQLKIEQHRAMLRANAHENV